MPGLRLIAINAAPKPLLKVEQIQQRVNRELNGFATDMVGVMGRYPSQQPTRYKRTGDLGRNWKIRRFPGSLAQIEVFNNVNRRGRHYAVYPQGPKIGSRLDRGPGTRQTRVMARKGWQNITDESERIWRRHELIVVRILQGGR